VLTAGVGSDSDLIASHERIAAMSTNSMHLVIEGASHEDLIQDQHDSVATSQAILDVVTSLRNTAPLGK
jgi:hypothetical protein